MRFNNLRNKPVPSFDEEDQLALPFADHLPLPPLPTITHRQLLEFGGRRKQAYELVVHQDPMSLSVLAYRLRPVPRH